MKKIYIAGQITGIEKEARTLFDAAEFDITQTMPEYMPVNPMDFSWNQDIDKGIKFRNAMREDIKRLCECDAIYMINNYKQSHGAQVELRIAIDLGLDIFFQK